MGAFNSACIVVVVVVVSLFVERGLNYAIIEDDQVWLSLSHWGLFDGAPLWTVQHYELIK